MPSIPFLFNISLQQTLRRSKSASCASKSPPPRIGRNRHTEKSFVGKKQEAGFMDSAALSSCSMTSDGMAHLASVNFRCDATRSTSLSQISFRTGSGSDRTLGPSKCARIFERSGLVKSLNRSIKSHNFPVSVCAVSIAVVLYESTALRKSSSLALAGNSSGINFLHAGR